MFFARDAVAATAYTLTPTSEGMQVKTPDGRVVFEYKTKVPADVKSPSAAYFDPVNTPSGVRVSNAGPDDHPWHRGIFLGILASEFRTPSDTSKAPPNHLVGAYNIRRADFWAWGLYAPKEGRVIKNQDIRLVGADAKHAQLEIVNEWTIDGKKVLDETNEVNVAERDGVFVIDLAYKLAPVVDYVIDQTAFEVSSFRRRSMASPTTAMLRAKSPIFRGRITRSQIRIGPLSLGTTTRSS